MQLWFWISIFQTPIREHFLWSQVNATRPHKWFVNIGSGNALVPSGMGLIWDNTKSTDALAPLQWRHNGRDGISNHQLHFCLLKRLFRHRSKKTSKLRVTGQCVGNSPGTGEFPTQMSSYAENLPIWWPHHVLVGSGNQQQKYWLYKIGWSLSPVRRISTTCAFSLFRNNKNSHRFFFLN